MGMAEHFCDEIRLENGLVLAVRDLSRRYFGDYFTVKMEIECLIHLERHLFDDEAAFQEASALLPKPVRFRRTLERAGIPSAMVSSVRDELLQSFLTNARPYVAAPHFPRRVIETELKRCRGRGGSR